MTGAPCAAFRPSQARVLCASAPLPEPGPISCGQVLIVNFVLFESLLAELFRRHGKPPVARRTARGGARSVCQFPDSAGGGAFGTRRRWGRRRSGLVCLSFRCVLGFRIESCSAGCRGAGRLCADHRLGRRCPQGLRACCWFALLLFEIPLHTVAFASAGAGRAAAEDSSGERGSSQNRKQMCSANGKRTGKHPCARQDLARRVQEVAIKQLETAQQAVTTAQEVVGRLTTLWLAELPGSEKANLLKQELNEAQQNYGMAQQKYAEAQQKYEEAQQNCKAASASIQAGRVQAGASACAVVAVAFDLHSRMVVVRFRGGPPLLLFGVVLSSRQGSPRRQAVSTAFTGGFSERRGSWLLQVSQKKCGCTCFAAWKRHVTQIFLHLVFCRCFRTGVSIRGSRLGGQPVFRSLCALEVAVVFV